MKVFGMEEVVSLPDEKYRSLIHMRDFVQWLLDPKETPRVPKWIRIHARSCLKHFPADYEIEKLAKKSPKIMKREK